jgi:hypothetical protein
MVAEPTLSLIWRQMLGLYQKRRIVLLSTVLRLQRGGFPLNHKHLKFHIDSLLQVWLGDSFPAKGVGKSWTDHFIEWHSAHLSCYWSSSLDTAHSHAVNPNTNAKWYNLLGNTIEEKGIEHDCIWAADESRFQPGKGLKEHVIGPAAQKNQYQQCDGNCENITIMVTICADGEEIPPTIIYKGQTFATNWHQDNEINAL